MGGGGSRGFFLAWNDFGENAWKFILYLCFLFFFKSGD